MRILVPKSFDPFCRNCENAPYGRLLAATILGSRVPEQVCCWLFIGTACILRYKQGKRRLREET
jgi:hypothetical protein